MNNEKIMGRKSYGSIPHLLGSKLGIGDKRINEGQHNIICKKQRHGDFIIAQEKLDGSCVSVYKDNNGIIHPLTRSGYAAETSNYKQHHDFHKWVMINQSRFNRVLSCGERIVGEWILQAHGTMINLWHEPFVAFDIMIESKRIPYIEFAKRVNLDFITPFIFRYGSTMSVEEILIALDRPSYHGQFETEGIVFRVEREGKVDFLAKYVRHGYEAGKYMSDEIYNPNYKNYL